jgi:trans-2,3-dihydro-3-hydroxyanthranilate isomerase
MDQARPHAGPHVDAEEVAAALGCPLDQSPSAQVWSTGVPQLMVRARDLAALEAMRPDHDALRLLGERDGWIGVSVYVLPGEPQERLRLRVRHFAPLVGVPEDPATGSAAGALGACLAAAGMTGPDGDLEMFVTQGVELGRPGEIAVRVVCADGTPSRVQVGGRVVPLFEGRMLDDGGAASHGDGR